MRLSLIAVAVAALALVLLGLAGPAYRLGLPLQTAFAMLRWAAYVGIAGMIAAAAAGLFAYYRRNRLAGLAAVTALAAALIAFGIPYQWQRRARNAPSIHDISTDLENPPEYRAIVPLRADAPNPLDRPTAVAEQQRRGYPDVAPITLAMPVPQAFDRALAVAQDHGWAIVTADKATGRIEATDTSRWFGFTDDIVVRLTMWGTGTRVDVRSASRVGLNDAGTNARRIRTFVGALQAR